MLLSTIWCMFVAVASLRTDRVHSKGQKGPKEIKFGGVSVNMIKVNEQLSLLIRLFSGVLAGSRMYLLVDQIVFSVGNFLLTILLARLYSDGEFGSYGIGLSVALIAQFIQRNLYIISLSLMNRRIATRLLPGILAQHLLVAGSTALLAALGTGIMMASDAGRASIDIALSSLVCIIIYFQADFDRAMQVKRGSYVGALGLSILYFFIVIAIAGLTKLLHWGFSAFMVSLGLLCAVKSLWLCILRVRPHWSWGLRLLIRDWRRNGMPSLIQAGSFAAGQHVPLMILAAEAGSAQVGGLLAMRSLTQPLILVIRSLDAGDKNRFRAVSCGTTAGARRVFWRTTMIYGAIGMCALAVLGIFPNQIIAFAYNDKYKGLVGVMRGWALYSALLGLTFPLQSLVYLLHRQRSFTFWVMVSGVIGACLAAMLCGHFGIRGAILAIVVSMAANVLSGVYVMRDVIIGQRDVPLPKELSTRRGSKLPI